MLSYIDEVLKIHALMKDCLYIQNQTPFRIPKSSLRHHQSLA